MDQSRRRPARRFRRSCALTSGMSEKQLDHSRRSHALPRRDRRDLRGLRRASSAAQAAIARRMYQLHGTHRGAPRERRARSASRSSSRGRGRRGAGDAERRRASRRSVAELAALYRRPRSAARRRVQAAPRRVAGDEAPLRGGEVPVPGARQGHRARPRHRVALAPARSQGLAARATRTGATPHLAARARAPPGQFPFTAGVFPLKREGEDPARMFAGEGGPERTNQRFHYVSRGLPAKRLSTAFDSVTLYGEDPDAPPRHLRQGRQLRRVDRQRRRREEALLGLRPLRSGDLRVDDDQRPGADAAGLLPQRRDRSAVREAGSASRAQADEVDAKIEATVRRARRARVRATRADFPTGNDGLGLMLLGVSGDDVLPREVYEQHPRRDALGSARHGAGRHPQRGPGPEHLHLLDRVRAAHDGRHPAVLHRAGRCGTSTPSRSPAITSPRRERTRSPSSRSRWPTASRSSSTTCRAA